MDRIINSSNFSIYKINAGERAQISCVVTSLFNNSLHSDKSLNLVDLNVHAERLPQGLRDFLQTSLESQCKYFLVDGIKIDDNSLGHTPRHWRDKQGAYSIFLQLTHCLISSVGDDKPGGYKTHQNGYAVTDIFPMKFFEHYQQGFGSYDELRFHTEDAFDENCASYFSLMCLRNPTHTPTTLFPADLTQLPKAIKNELFKKQFYLSIDDSHTGVVDKNECSQPTHTQLDQTYKIRIFSGSEECPDIRIDPVNMDISRISPSASYAFNYLYSEIEKSRILIELKPGQILFVNNKKITHGRSGFKAQYSGFDRWLTRVLLFNQQILAPFQLRKE